MLNDRLQVAMHFATELKAIESGLNESMERVGNLFAAIPSARAKLGKHVPLNAGIDATESLAAAAASLASSYRLVIEAHGRFAEDRDRLGLQTVNWGDIQACPPKTAEAQNGPILHAVKAA
jgi:hypothetical protein